jgi:type I restriction enzyme S subunit
MQRGIINKNDILVVKDGATTGKVSIVKNDFPFNQAAINEHLFLVRTNKNLLNPLFAFYFLYSSVGNSQILTDFRGSAQGGISREFVNKVSIPLPPLPIQKQIAEILEKADEAKQKRKEANKLTDEFLQSVFIEMFGDPVKNPMGWEIKLIKYIIREPLKSGIAGRPSPDNEGILHIRPYNINDSFRLCLIQKKFIKLNYELSNYKLLNGDVVFNNTNSPELVGKATVFNLSNEEAVFSNHMTRIRLNVNKCLPSFLVFVFFNYWKQRYFEVRCTQWVNQAAFNIAAISKFELPVPPLPFQQQFAGIVNKTEALKEKQKQSEQELENLFQSLMHRAFKGELVS